MSFADGKVLLCRLYERTSLKGHRYLAGRLGYAKLIPFLDTRSLPPRFGCVQRWQRPQAENPAEDCPFFDDPDDNIGRDR